MAQTLTRTQKRQNATKARIFQVAMELFIAKGFDNTTVSEITEAADIGKGTFFTYFPTKEAIFRQLGAMMMETMSAVAEDGLNQNQPISLVLKNTLLASVDWHEANKPITQQVVRSHFSIDAETSNKNRLVEVLESLVLTGQSNGEFNSEFNARDAAVVLAGSYFAVIAFWAVTEGEQLRERLASSIDIVLNGMVKNYEP